jgi:hypothetical protein
VAAVTSRILALAFLTASCADDGSEQQDGGSAAIIPPVSTNLDGGGDAAQQVGQQSTGPAQAQSDVDGGLPISAESSADAGASRAPSGASMAEGAAVLDASVSGGDGGNSDAARPSSSGGASPCAGGTLGKDSASTKTPGLNVSREYGAVKYLAAAGVEIRSLKTTLQVPATPAQKQTLFIWPALQSLGAADPNRVRNGILQPVLTWGGSCNPKIPSPSEYYSKWWIAGMYVNVSSNVAGPTGCAGGDYMLTEVGDLLDTEISLRDGKWVQTIVNTRTMKSVAFAIDLKGQVQNWATWAVEVPSGETIVPAADTIFTQSVLTFSAPVTTCQPSQAGTKDSYSAPVLSADGLHCCYDKIVLAKH